MVFDYQIAPPIHRLLMDVKILRIIRQYRLLERLPNLKILSGNISHTYWMILAHHYACYFSCVLSSFQGIIANILKQRV